MPKKVLSTHRFIITELKTGMSIIDTYRMQSMIQLFWVTIVKIIQSKDTNIYVHGFGLFKIIYKDTKTISKAEKLEKELKKFASSIKML